MLCLTETWVHDPEKLTKWINFSPIGKDYTVFSDSLTPYTIKDTNSNGQGTCINLRKNWLPFLQKEQILRVPGRATGLLFKRLKETIFILCLYLPQKTHQRSKEYRQLSRTIMKKLKNLPENSKIIIMGDFKILH
jgi:exonuclease III